MGRVEVHVYKFGQKWLTTVTSFLRKAAYASVGRATSTRDIQSYSTVTDLAKFLG
jgi:hypothetical protein